MLCGGWTSRERRASWFPIVPERTKSAEGLPRRDAMRDSRDWVVVHSLYTSSPRFMDSRAASMDLVGVVSVSPGGPLSSDFI